MRTARRIAKNSVVILLARLLSGGSNVVILALLARYLGREDFGRYNYVMAFVAAFQLFIDFGFSNILVREAAVDKANARRYFGALLTLMGAASVIVCALMWVLVRFTHHDTQVAQAIAVSALATVVAMQVALSNAIFRAFERLEWEAATLLVSQALLVVGIIVIVTDDRGFQSIFLLFLIVNLLHWVFNLAASAWKFVRPSFAFAPRLWRSLLVAAAPLGVAQVLRKVTWQVDALLLKALIGYQAVGLFSGAYRIIWGLNILPASLAVPLFPVFSNLAKSSPEQLLSAYQRSLKFLFALALPIAVVGTLAAPTIIRLLLGGGYGGSVLALQLLIWTVALVFPASIFPYLFTACHRQRVYTICCAASLGTNVVLDLLFIPSLRHIGACLGTVTAEVILFTAGVHYLRDLGAVAWGQVALKPLLAAAVMTASLYPFHRLAPLGLALAVAASCGVYLVALLLLRTFPPEEMEMLPLGRWLARRAPRVN